MEKKFKELKNFLDMHNIVYKAYEHEPVHTSEEASRIRGVELRTGVKALVFEVKKDKTRRLVMVLVSGDKKVDNKKLIDILDAENVKLASPQAVLEETSCEIGSVHPFGNLFGLEVYMDKRIMENKEVNFSAGLHTKSITMRAEDIVRLIKPEIIDIAK